MQIAESVTDEVFGGEVLEYGGLAVVDFWAPSCAPCRMLSPIIDELAHQYRGRARVVKINVEENPLTAGEFGVRSIPALIFIRSGKVVETMVGLAPKAVLAGKIDGHLGLDPDAGAGPLSKLKGVVAGLFGTRQPRLPPSGSGCC